MSSLPSEENDILLDEDQDVVTVDRYRVLLHNDDYTTMDFVIMVLRKIFLKTTEQAETIMWKVHQDGVGVCGIYVYEVAETKLKKTESLARKEGFPLKVTLEKEE